MARMRFNRSKFRRELRKLTREIEKEAKKEIKKVKVEIPVEYAITKPEGGGGMTLKVKATKVLQALHDRVNGSITESADLKEISNELGYSKEEFDAIWMYLCRNNWIEGMMGGHAYITVDGIEYLEEQKDNKLSVSPMIQQNIVYGGQNIFAQSEKHAEVNYISNDSSRQLIDVFKKKKEGGQWPPSSRIQGPGKIQFPAVSEEGSLNVLVCQWTLLPPANGIRSAIASWITPFRDHDSEAFLQPFSHQPPVAPRIVFAPAQQDRLLSQIFIHPARIQLVQASAKGPVILLTGETEPLPFGGEGFVTGAAEPPGSAPGDRHGAQRGINVTETSKVTGVHHVLPSFLQAEEPTANGFFGLLLQTP